MTFFLVLRRCREGVGGLLEQVHEEASAAQGREWAIESYSSNKELRSQADIFCHFHFTNKMSFFYPLILPLFVFPLPMYVKRI